MADTHGSKNTTATIPLGLGHSNDNGNHQLERAKSKISIEGVLQYAEHHQGNLELLSPEDRAREECLINFINSIDKDENGQLDGQEIYLAMRGFYDDAVAASEEAKRASRKMQKYKRTIGVLTAGMALLVATVFGTSMAAAYLAKDTEVQNRALFTKGGEAVGINLNEVSIPLASLAFMPSQVASKIEELVLADDDGNKYHRVKQAIDIAPGKSVTLRTTEGDQVSWEATEESSNTVSIELVNGNKTWNMSSLCKECTAVSVVIDEAVTNALGKFYASVGVGDHDNDEGRRVLCGYPCPKGHCRMPYSCSCSPFYCPINYC